MDEFGQHWTRNKEKPQESHGIHGVNGYQQTALDNDLVPGTRIELVQPKAEGF